MCTQTSSTPHSIPLHTPYTRTHECLESINESKTLRTEFYTSMKERWRGCSWGCLWCTFRTAAQEPPHRATACAFWGKEPQKTRILSSLSIIPYVFLNACLSWAARWLAPLSHRSREEVINCTFSLVLRAGRAGGLECGGELAHY